MQPLRLLVTRPRHEARRWCAKLRGAGIDAAPLPLIDVLPWPDPAPLVQAWHALFAAAPPGCPPVYAMAVFVSPAAVEHFFAQRPAGRVWPQHIWAAGPGPGTAEALRVAGVPPALLREPRAEAASFDSEALWRVIGQQLWSQRRVLIVRGDDGDSPSPIDAAPQGDGVNAGGSGRAWLTERLRQAGAQVETLAVYRRAAPTWSAAEQTLFHEAQARPQEAVWLLSSSMALAALGERLEGARPPGQALCTHARIAARARAAGFAMVHETRPTVPDVILAVRALQGSRCASA